MSLFCVNSPNGAQPPYTFFFLKKRGGLFLGYQEVSWDRGTQGVHENHTSTQEGLTVPLISILVAGYCCPQPPGFSNSRLAYWLLFRLNSKFPGEREPEQSSSGPINYDGVGSSPSAGGNRALGAPPGGGWGWDGPRRGGKN